MFSSGMLVQKYGAKLVLLVGLFLSAIIIILTPLAVTLGMRYWTVDCWLTKIFKIIRQLLIIIITIGDVYGLVIARALTGLFQAPIFPCYAAFKIAWFPVEQRGRFSALTSVGLSVNFVRILVEYFFVKLNLFPSDWWNICNVFYRNIYELCWTMGFSILLPWSYNDAVLHFNCKFL